MLFHGVRMNADVRFKQPCDVVRNRFARYWRYSVLAVRRVALFASAIASLNVNAQTPPDPAAPVDDVYCPTVGYECARPTNVIVKGNLANQPPQYYQQGFLVQQTGDQNTKVKEAIESGVRYWCDVFHNSWSRPRENVKPDEIDFQLANVSCLGSYSGTDQNAPAQWYGQPGWIFQGNVHAKYEIVCPAHFTWTRNLGTAQNDDTYHTCSMS
jgi:hypothetical protein